MAVLGHLEPQSVFLFFEQICAIPHGSGNTKTISDWLVRFAQARGLEHVQDAWNNVIIIKKATAGYENAAPVILQGHMDMVCAEAPACKKDMAHEGLELAVEGDTVYAKGTTLGGDDGIAVAMALAVLDAHDLCHPRVEAVFTVDEETGMQGAMHLDTGILKGKRMLNLDSEVEGVFTVSCAGGNVSRCVLPVERADFSGAGFTISIDGLQGGHSGVEIHKGRANANVLLGRVLYALRQKTAFRIAAVEGGRKDNAIPVSARAAVVVAGEEAVRTVCADMQASFRNEYRVTDPGVSVTVSAEPCGTPLDEASTGRAVCMLSCLPDGIQAMSADIPGLVQTSLNLGILTTEAQAVTASFCVRSSVASQKQMLVNRLHCLMTQLGGRLEVSGDYPGWEYRKESPLRELMTEVFTEQYGHAPKIEAIHAGVECGLFAGKIPGLDCVSFGPDLTDIHTFRERMHIASVGRTWALVTEVLRRMKEL